MAAALWVVDTTSPSSLSDAPCVGPVAGFLFPPGMRGDSSVTLPASDTAIRSTSSTAAAAVMIAESQRLLSYGQRMKKRERRHQTRKEYDSKWRLCRRD